MHLRGVLAACVLAGLVQPAVRAQQMMVPRIDGRVFVDLRPVDWLLEVRLEAQTGETVATAYTAGSEEFIFENLILNPNLSYYTVIEEPGFELVRHELRPTDFVADEGRGFSRFSGLITLSLVRVPEPGDDGGAEPGPAAVDIRELQAEIPDQARRELDEGFEARDRGAEQDAIARFERAVELAPDWGEALNALGAAYLRAGREPEAEETLVRARDLNPNDPLPLTNLGTLYFQRGQRVELGEARSSELGDADGLYRRAVNALEEAVRLDPTDTRTTLYLGSALYEVGDYDRAEFMLLTALAMEADLDEARLTLFNVYVRQQRFSEAVEQVDLFLLANPDAPRREALEALREQIVEGAGLR